MKAHLPSHGKHTRPYLSISSSFVCGCCCLGMATRCPVQPGLVTFTPVSTLKGSLSTTWVASTRRFFETCLKLESSSESKQAKARLLFRCLLFRCFSLSAREGLLEWRRLWVGGRLWAGGRLSKQERLSAGWVLWGCADEWRACCRCPEAKKPPSESDSQSVKEPSPKTSSMSLSCWYSDIDSVVIGDPSKGTFWTLGSERGGHERVKGNVRGKGLGTATAHFLQRVCDAYQS